MRLVIIYLLLLNAIPLFSQDFIASGRKFVPPDTKNSAENGSSGLEIEMLNVIRSADETYAVSDLCDIIAFCSTHCSKSDTVSIALTEWLRENNSIYTHKSPTETNQFRGFLIYSLSKFKPNELLYDYIRSELQFGEYAFNIAAAAYTARNYKSRSMELIDLFAPYLKTEFRDELVDITTYKLRYPIANPTRVRYEVLETLVQFGPDAYGALSMIDQLHRYISSNRFYNDSVLVAKCAYASRRINDLTPICCRKAPAVKPMEKYIKLISKNEREPITARNLPLIDQEGRSVQFKQLTGKPFVLTFFYTRCANPLKCVSTIDRLARLQQALINQQTINKVGIYAITYDPEFDKPSLLKSFGNVYGIKFSENVRFLLPADESAKAFTSQLQLRVNYGYGSVNLHGSQLYLFDKKGRLSLVSDNEKWTVDQVMDHLNRLMGE